MAVTQSTPCAKFGCNHPLMVHTGNLDRGQQKVANFQSNYTGCSVSKCKCMKYKPKTS